MSVLTRALLLLLGLGTAAMGIFGLWSGGQRASAVLYLLAGAAVAWEAISRRGEQPRADRTRPGWRLYLGLLFAVPAVIVLLGSLALGVSLSPNGFGLAAVFLCAGGAFLYYDMA
jgi:hypothetical protein